MIPAKNRIQAAIRRPIPFRIWKKAGAKGMTGGF